MRRKKEVYLQQSDLSCFLLTQKGRADLVKRYDDPTGGETHPIIANAFTHTRDVNNNSNFHPNFHSF